MPWFPDITDYTPDAQDAIRRAVEELGLVAPRLRCGMPEFAVSGLPQWSGAPIFVEQKITLRGLSDVQVASAYGEACDNWNAVCGCSLQSVHQSSGLIKRANVLANSGKIDGSSGTLAYSYLPGENEPMSSQLAQLFDDSEKWTYAWLVEVVCHEVGHALGLPHSSDPNALMYPYSHGGSIPKPQVWDIGQVVQRYGEPPTNSGRWSGAVVSPDGKIYSLSLDPV